MVRLSTRTRLRLRMVTCPFSRRGIWLTVSKHGVERRHSAKKVVPVVMLRLRNRIVSSADSLESVGTRGKASCLLATSWSRVHLQPSHRSKRSPCARDDASRKPRRRRSKAHVRPGGPSNGPSVNDCPTFSDAHPSLVTPLPVPIASSTNRHVRSAGGVATGSWLAST